ncbi:MAG: lysophospholipid acyltransferase family protein [Lacipirellulaceae bacterium]
MKLRSPLLQGLVASTMATTVRAWMSTMRYEAVYDDPLVDPAHHTNEPFIYVLWHEHMGVPIYLRADCGIAILVSKHRDADALDVIARRSGFECVRGSTARGGAAALRELVERGQRQHLVITPDGPQGPRRTMAAGPVYLASKLGRPIVPMGFAADRAWRTPTWDQFLIPKPFARVKAWMGAPITVPADLDREGLEAARARVEGELNRVTEAAEAWAAGGPTPAGAAKARRERTSRRPRAIARNDDARRAA